jgi:hypothetical protein
MLGILANQEGTELEEMVHLMNSTDVVPVTYTPHAQKCGGWLLPVHVASVLCSQFMPFAHFPVEICSAWPGGASTRLRARAGVGRCQRDKRQPQTQTPEFGVRGVWFCCCFRNPAL